ncbi:MAG: 50S ribosome-binding GTPase [Dehalococcoidia bacterium]|nr:50S ribosome-binding GTPase [Dehalococcoidia bacterium]
MVGSEATASDAATEAPSELLRFATAGSVDDGKSTLIGRLLYDSKQIFQDQLEALERASVEHGDEYVNLALLTDGLRAEREQGITIDVAYRYFATPKRKFIIADSPGHVQYTRNMVTGASTADLALVLVDARAGIVEQTRRHAYLSSLLGIRHLVLCVNKMDLVGYAVEPYREIAAEFLDLASRLEVHAVTCIPISALNGDNIVERSDCMPWYVGPTLLEHLERVEVGQRTGDVGGRFPVQLVIRPMRNEFHDYRGYAGEMAGGPMRVGDEVVVLPSGRRSRIEGIDNAGASLDEAVAPMSVTLRLADQIDVGRGDMIASADAPPRVGRALEAMVCWMSDRAELQPGRRYVLKHTTRRVRAMVDAVVCRLNVDTLALDTDEAPLRLNDIGRVRLRTTEPLCYDPYRVNRATGSFILIDEATNDTVAAGMIEEHDFPEV